MIASGVAKPKLQGQATTKIVTNTLMELPTLYPSITYIKKVTIAIKITMDTKYPLTLSTILAMGAFVLVASITNLTISDMVDSLPIFTALYSKYPS